MAIQEKTDKVIVAGAGLMGRGIAHGFASAGYRTVLFDINADQLANASSNIKQVVADGVRLGKVTEDDGNAALDRLTTSTSLADAAKGANLMVETVVEKLSVKQDVLREAETVMAEGALIGSNTSALSVTEIATASKDPSRVGGLHYFNPVHKMKLVEIVRGIATSDETVAAFRTYCDDMNKTSIVVNDAPGLTTSRMSCLLGNEAMYMLEAGTASAEDIDTALRMGFNHPMGPLELGDLTGWDTRLSVLRYLHSVLGEKFRPCPLIIKMVASGRLGRKVGHGVYKYENGQKVPGSGLKGSVL
jgi:3-hydroxybutyryl-CoA dehydrogenase